MLATRINTRENTQFITADGIVYNLSTPPDRVIVSEEGAGLPEIDYVTQRGPYQHGETLLDMFLRPRIMQYVIRHQYCSRDAYWKGRSALLDALRPNRGTITPPGQGVLRRTLPDGSKRDLTCVLQQGPAFSPRQQGQWDEWAYTETLRFIANNPLWFNPTPIEAQFSATLDLLFPITFPITFGELNSTIALNYGGTWDEYPTLVLTGPLNTITITNATTGEIIKLNYDLLAGHTATIALTYGAKTITLDDGTNLIGYIDPSSSLVAFTLVPGVNTITVQTLTSGATGSVVMTYYERFLGI